MSDSTVRGEAEGTAGHLDAAQAAGLLHATTQSRHFRDSPRQSALLSYLVTQESEGHGDRLSAYAVAFDVFERDSSFNPAIDSIVRVEMHRLRANLQAWRDDPDNPADSWITVPPRSYRPQIADRAASRLERAPGWRVWLARKRIQVWSALALILVVAALVLLFQRERDRQCRSARPELLIAESVKGVPADQARAMLDQLRNYLAYYPLVSVVDDPEPDCDGVPRFALNLTAFPEKLFVELRSLQGGKVVFSKDFPLYPGDRSRATSIALAQIAYLLEHDSGIIPVNALRAEWTNDSAEDEFRCVMLTHQFFLTDSSPTFYDQGRNCLIRHYETSPHADVSAMLAAIELERKFVPAFEKGKTENYYDLAIKRAQKLDMYNSELLIVELRNARLTESAQVGDVLVIINMMKKILPLEPSILNQASIAECRFAEQFSEGLRDRALAATLSLGLIDNVYAAAYCNIGLGRDQENLKHIDAILADKSPSSQIVGLQIADANGKTEMIELIKENLRQQDCDTRACTQKVMSEVRSGPILTRRISEALVRNLER